MTAAGADTPQYSDLVQVLAGASVIARNFWDVDGFDIYDCARRSWYVRGMPVAFAAVLRATRKAVPGGDIYAFNDAPGRTAVQIAKVFATATGEAMGAEHHRALVGASVPFTGGGDR